MIDARYKNKAGYTFIAWAGNPYVEVFRPVDLVGVKLHEAVPYEVWYVGNVNESELKRLGNELTEYSRMV